MLYCSDFFLQKEKGDLWDSQKLMFWDQVGSSSVGLHGKDDGSPVCADISSSDSAQNLRCEGPHSLVRAGPL